MVVVFVSDARLKRRTERNLFALKSSKTKPLLMRTWSWTRTRVSSTSVVDCFCGFNLFKQGYDVVETFYFFTQPSLFLLTSCRAQFASVDEVHKEEIRREKRRSLYVSWDKLDDSSNNWNISHCLWFFSNQRNKDNTSFIWNSRIQEQLRRIKRNQEKEKLQPVKKKKEKPPNNVSTLIHLYCCKVWGTIVEQPRWAEGQRFLNPKIFSFNLSPLYLLLHFLITKKLHAYIPACWSQWCFLTLEVNATLKVFLWKPDTSDLPLLEVRNLLPPSVYLVSVLFGFCLTAPFWALPPITSSTAAYGKSYRNTWHLYSIWDSFQ